MPIELLTLVSAERSQKLFARDQPVAGSGREVNLGQRVSTRIFPTALTLIWHFYNFYLILTDLLNS